MSRGRSRESAVAEPRDERVLILADGRDATLTCGILSRAEIDCQPCSTIEDVCAEILTSPGAMVLAEEFLTSGTVAKLVESLRRQPPWSDLPLLVVARGEETAPGVIPAVNVLGMVTVLPRPMPVETLVSTVKSALLARRRQYQVRDLLAQRDEADRRKDEFLAMLAHELRNPLAPIANAARIVALRSGGDPLLERQQDTIARQVRHMAHLLEDLLDVSRITSGKIVLQKQRIDLLASLRETVESCGPEIRGRQQELTVRLPEGTMEVDADPTRVQQIFVNLLNNASRYTPAGGCIAVSAERENATAVVRVRDTGDGIAPELLEHVFELFVQGRRTLARTEGGLGIGLTMVKRLAELHGGGVAAHSDGLGQGSEFVVCLPLAQAATRGVDRPAAPPVSVGERLRVLVVDDNVDGAESLSDCLALLDYETRVAFDGPTAVELAAQFQPHVVLLDIGLPGLDGYEVARRLRQGVLPEALVVAVSGYGREEDRRLATEAGFDHHLTKPVALEALEALLRDGSAGRNHGRPDRP
jgi:signal transduction histidine kinase/CheY-like chemotaxis protein